MASDNETHDDNATATTETAAEIADDGSQKEIDWAEAVMEEFEPSDDKGDGEVEGEGEAAGDDTETEVDEKPDVIEAFGEADLDKKVEIKNKDGSVSYKTIRQLVDEGLMQSDYTRGKQKLKDDQEQLADDRAILDLINKDKKTRDFLMNRMGDIKEGRGDEDAFNIEVPKEVLEQLPWLNDLINKVKSQDVELSQYRATQKQSQANQTVGKIETVMKTALTAIQKETGLELKPAEFRARVGKAIIDSLDDDIPEDKRILVAGQLILTDKKYYLSKARESYQQELELAKDKSIDEAKKQKSKGTQKKRDLPGGGTGTGTVSVGAGVVKDAKGNPDLGATILAFHKGGGGRK